jgi:signal transduction histidine kinase
VTVPERRDRTPAVLDASHALGGLVIEPLMADVGAPASATPTHAGRASDAALVLVVEDNADMRSFVVETLARDHRVVSAVNGGDGFAQVRELKPDLVVTDVMMPEMSGEQLVEAMRADPELESIPVIVLTAKADEDLRLSLLRHGAQDYVMKPFSREELRARVQTFVSLQQARRELEDALATKIVGELVDFGRIKPPQREPIQIGALVVEQLARVAFHAGVRIDFDVPDDLPRAHIDPVQMGQVVLNLLVNAAQAMEQIDGSLTLRARALNGFVEIHVIDSGPGVPPALHDKIFDALFTTKARGIGLGLAVSRSLAEANGGQLCVASEPGRGASFVLSVPTAPAAVMTAAEESIQLG